MHTYRYVPRGGTRASAAALGWPEPAIVKTLVFADDDGTPFLVLMPGDGEVSERAMARQRGVRRVAACAVATAERHTGYRVGGTSPFGTRKALPVYVDRSALAPDRVLVNGGARGVLVALDPTVFVTLLDATPVDVRKGSRPPDHSSGSGRSASGSSSAS